ncbi:MAG: phosphate acetyltransferase [Calditrichaeota bacterium]|nr:MAG: phosphate acetyltransferase [Calditrichota bacterium]MBL1205739.1 phosphate acetyltransferase [Calditrichota bacterium]NOG45567.1 phosphate acetyltransferase [Calditrichota bacterium]
MTFLEKLKLSCKQNPQSVIFSEANDERIIQAARFIQDQGFAKPILIGGAFEVRDTASKINISTKGLKIINPNNEMEARPYKNHLIQQAAGKSLNRVEIDTIIREPITQSLMRLIGGNADIAFAGNRGNIAQVISNGLKWSGIHGNYKRVSSFYLMVSQDNKNIYAFSDCSINVAPNSNQLAEIALKTAETFFKTTGRQPRVAFLSFSTKGSAKHKKVDLVRDAVSLFNENNVGYVCDGELQFDAAVDQVIAKQKAPNGYLNGIANVFIFPSLDSANIAQKIASQIGGYTSIGPMVQGLNNSLHCLTRSCTVEEVINSVLLASAMKKN